MKEMLKSKMMILFIAMVLGITYMSSTTERLEDEKREEYQQMITMNMQ